MQRDTFVTVEPQPQLEPQFSGVGEVVTPRLSLSNIQQRRVSGEFGVTDGEDR